MKIVFENPIVSSQANITDWPYKALKKMVTMHFKEPDKLIYSCNITLNITRCFLGVVIDIKIDGSHQCKNKIANAIGKVI